MTIHTADLLLRRNDGSRGSRSLSALSRQLDTQHRDLLASISRLGTVRMSHTRPDRVRGALADIHRLAYYHCSTEGRLVETAAYRERLAHLADHDVLKATLDVYLLRAEMDAIGPGALTSLLHFLGTWFVNHAANFDEPLYRWALGR